MASSQNLSYSLSKESAELVDSSCSICQTRKKTEISKMASNQNLSHSLSKGSAELVDNPCSICQTRKKIEVESTHYCVDCDSNMCAACSESHAGFPAMASHQVVGISQAPGTPAQKAQLPTQRCEEHHGRVIDHYCQDDDQTCCETCVNLYRRHCVQMKYIPKIAKGSSKGNSSQAIKKSTGDLMTELKKVKSSKEDNSKQLDKAEAKCHQEVQDLRTRLHKHVDNLADADDDKIKSEFQKKKGEVQKDIAEIDDQIDAAKTINKKLNSCKGDNKSELFVYIKQGEKVERDAQQKLQALRKSKVTILAYKFNSGIEKSLKDVKSLGQFEKATSSAKLNKQIKVRDAKDVGLCTISGICLLPEASLIIADYNNSSLKLVDPSQTLAGHLDMPDKPVDVCYTDNNEVAITLSLITQTVQFVSVGPNMQKTRSFKIGVLCRGITYSSGQLFVCCGLSVKPTDVCVRVYSLSGSLLHTIQHDQAGQLMFTYPLYITLSSCGSKLHVTDRNKGIVTTDIAGKLLATYTDPDMTYPHGICCLDTHDMLISDYNAHCVHHVSGDGRKLGKLLTGKDGLANPQAVCYDPALSRLFVCMENNDYIKVYDIRGVI